MLTEKMLQKGYSVKKKKCLMLAKKCQYVFIFIINKYKYKSVKITVRNVGFCDIVKNYQKNM